MGVISSFARSLHRNSKYGQVEGLQSKRSHEAVNANEYPEGRDCKRTCFEAKELEGPYCDMKAKEVPPSFERRCAVLGASVSDSDSSYRPDSPSTEHLESLIPWSEPQEKTWSTSTNPPTPASLGPTPVGIPSSILELRFVTVLRTFPDLARVIHDLVEECGTIVFGVSGRSRTPLATRRDSSLALPLLYGFDGLEFGADGREIPAERDCCDDDDDTTLVPGPVCEAAFGAVLERYPPLASVIDHVQEDWSNAFGFHPQLEVPSLRERYCEWLRRDGLYTVLDLVSPIHPSMITGPTCLVDFAEVRWDRPASIPKDPPVSPLTKVMTLEVPRDRFTADRGGKMGRSRGPERPMKRHRDLDQ